MNLIKQTIAVTTLNLRSLPMRIGSSIVTIIGIAGVVTVLLSILSMAAGFERTVLSRARLDHAIVLSLGAESEAASKLTRTNVGIMINNPGLKKDQSGSAVYSADALIVAPVARKGDSSDAYVTLRGMSTDGLRLRSEIKIIEGKSFSPGRQEVIVGRAARAQFSGLAVGDRVVLRGGEWTVVGVFSSDGSSHESTILADAETVMSAYKLNEFNSLTLLLESPKSFTDFKDAVSANPELLVDVKREKDYVEFVSRRFNNLLRLIAYVIGSVMAVGALFGALNTMYSAVFARRIEIATLRALGFESTTIVVSVLIEALMLSLLGAVAGAVIAYGLYNGESISTLGGALSSSQIVFPLNLTPSITLIGVIVACSIGLVGGAFPAIRAARLPIASALRAT